MRNRVSLAGCLLLLLAACHDAGNSITAPESPSRGRTKGNITVTGSGRILRSPPAGFVEASRSTQMGTRSSKGGCKLHNSESLASGQRVSMYVAEFDPRTCEFVLARSVVQPRAAATVLTPDRGLTRSAPTQVMAARTRQAGQSQAAPKMQVPEGPRMNWVPCDGSEDCADYSYSTGSEGGTVTQNSFQDLWVEDPVGFMMNQDFNRIDSWTDSQTGCFTFARAIHGRYRLGTSGWRYGSFYNYWRETSCQTIDNITGSYYHNPVWCCG